MPSATRAGEPSLRVTSQAYLAGVLALAFLSNLFAGLVSTLMAAYLPDSVQDLAGSVDEAQVSRIGSYVGSLFLAGWTLGGVVMGWAGDRMGRVRMFAAAVFIYAVFTLLAAWSPTWHVLVACRFLTGVGIGATLVLSAVVVAEAWPERTRAVALGIMAVGYPIGIISAGLINYMIADWRTAFLIGAAPLAVALLCGLLRESESWRALQSGRIKADRSEIRALFSPENRTNFIVGATIFGTMLVGLWATFSWLPTWVQSLFGPGEGGQQERGLVMMLLGTGGIAGGLVSGLLANAIGRKRSLLLTFAGCFVASFILFWTNSSYTPIILVEAAFLAIFFGISQGLLTAYIPELFPTAIRSTATGMCFNAGRVVTAGAVFFVGVPVSLLGGYGNAILAFSLMYVIGFFVTLWGRETQGVPL